MSLNPGQQAAVDEPGNCLIVACPGSGKTHTLVARSERLLGESPDRRIAIVTFTRAAADELKERLVRKMGRNVLPRIEAGTFHSLCLEQLARVNGGRRPFGIASEGTSHTLMMKAWQLTWQRYPRAQLSRDVVQKGIEYYKANGRTMPQTQHPDAMMFAIEQYGQMLKAQKLWDFADILLLTKDGILNGTIPALPVSDLLVDEFQDVDAVQLEWVLAHVSLGIRATCVGDDDQSIYGFRFGKGYDGMQTFARLARAETITLDTTYRCSQLVIAHAAKLIGKNTARVAKTIRTANPATGTVERRDFPSVGDEVDAICEAMARRPHGSTAAILARNRGIIRTIQTALLQAHLRFVGGVEGGIWSGGVPGLFFNLMGAVLGKNPLGATMALSVRGIRSASIHAAREQITAAGGRMDALLASAGWLKTAHDNEITTWEGMRSAYATVAGAGKASPSEFVRICEPLIRPGVDAFTDDKVITNVIKIIDDMPGTLADVYRRIELDNRTDADKTSDKVTLSLLTLHASKGLEFDQVWMPAMRHGTLPYASSEIDEERRLCYVGMTRARGHLVMSFSPTRDAMTESAFLTECGLPNTRRVRLAARTG